MLVAEEGLRFCEHRLNEVDGSLAVSEKSDALRGRDVPESNVYGGKLCTQDRVEGGGVLGETKHPATVVRRVKDGGSN